VVREAFERRAERRREAAREGGLRLLVAFGLGLVVQAALLLGLVLAATLGPGAARPKETRVAFVSVPAAQWDATMGASRPPSPGPVAPHRPKPPAPEPVAKLPPEEIPGQIVDVAPGNAVPPRETRFVAETTNSVEKESIARDRRADRRATAPRETTSVRPPESERSGKSTDPEKVALGLPDAKPAEAPRPEEESSLGSRLELPRLLPRDRLALKLEGPGPGRFANREETEELRGNSDRFRVQTGDGTDDAAATTTGGKEGSRELASLVPSGAVLDRISGAPAPDHVEGVEEGEATFLNTREWKYASFFNRVKDSVAAQWDPVTVLRRRDPRGELYAWKDRYTVVQITLEPDGRMVDAWVEKPSGVEFLDREALAAFERAQPFPNPPPGMANEKGQITFSFGFFLETSRPGLRLFRGPTGG